MVTNSRYARITQDKKTHISEPRLQCIVQTIRCTFQNPDDTEGFCYRWHGNVTQTEERIKILHCICNHTENFNSEQPVTITQSILRDNYWRSKILNLTRCSSCITNSMRAQLITLWLSTHLSLLKVGCSFPYLLSNQRKSFSAGRVSSSLNVAVTPPLVSTEDHTQSPRWVRPQHPSVCEQTGITLSRYMMEMARWD